MTRKSFRFVSTDRRVREDRRFVVGKGRFAADIAAADTRLQGLRKHVPDAGGMIIAATHIALPLVAVKELAL